MSCLRDKMLIIKSTIVCLCFLISSTSIADEYVTDFESLNSSMFGVSLTGQDNYYIPAGTTSVDFNVYDYTDNSLSIALNPNGGSQFIAGEGPGGGTFARAQRDLAFSSGVVDVTYDMAALSNGSAPGSNNLGSFSSQGGGVFGYIHLMTWADINTATNFQADFIGFNAANEQTTFVTPGSAFDALDLNHWYKFTTRLDFNTNQITRVSIEDLTAGTSTSEDLTGIYMRGGATGGVVADGFRFFGGGGDAGNITAWDNMSVVDVATVPEPTSTALLLLGSGLGLIVRRKRRLA